MTCKCHPVPLSANTYNEIHLSKEVYIQNITQGK